MLRPWWERLRAELPDLELFDVHSHIGSNDPDGFRSTAAALNESLASVGARAVVFPMHEPEGYPRANDRVLAEAAASGGRLVPFCRLDPHDDPVRELDRCLAAGARGVKLHPRAERFALNAPAAVGIFVTAHERRLPVLVHAGRGIPALGRHALELADRYPGARIVLAHAGISDLSWIWRHAADHPNLFFDTAWWSVADLLALFSLVPPGQILFGSDAPYGTPLQAAVTTFRCALQVGLSGEQVTAVGGGQLSRILEAEEPLNVGPAPGVARLQPDVLLDRVNGFLTVAVNRLLHGENADEPLALARLACEVGEEAPQAPVCRSVLALLDRRDRMASVDGAPGPQGAGAHLAVIAAVLTRTPDVSLPVDPEPVEVGERAP